MDLEATVVYQRNYNSDKRFVINRGGTRSSKTYSICQLIVTWLFFGRIDAHTDPMDKGVLSVVRKYKSTLEATVVRDFEDILHKNEFYNLIKHDKTKRTYSYQGRTVEFMGADDEQKLRGSTRDILYCNEANELAYKKEFFQLMIRTRGKVFIDFNPDDEDIWINTEFEQKRKIEEGDVDVLISTYKDNPYLPKTMVDEIERLEKVDPMYWQIYGLGNYGKLEGLVFNNFFECEQIPLDGTFIAYGLDFGFTNDPTAFIEIHKYDQDLYIKELIYETGLTNDDICKKFEEKGVDMSKPIWADSAEPKSIEEIFRKGYNIKGVRKGKDSIMYGIDLIKQQKVFYTEDSMNIRKETKHYQWAEDKNGLKLNKPKDNYNHGIDAIRYVAMEELKSDFARTNIHKKRRSLEEYKRKMGMA